MSANNGRLHVEMNAQETALTTARLTHIHAMKNKCPFCGGGGHQFKECPSKANLDRNLTSLGFEKLWSEVKTYIKKQNDQALYDSAKETVVKNAKN